MRVGIIALLQESNTFIQDVTTLKHFESELLCEGEEVRRRLQGTLHETGGFFQGLETEKIEAVPIFAARALPYGTVTAETFAALMTRLQGALAKSGPVDGVLVAPHGATVSADIPDVDGHWLRLVRAHYGPKVPIIGTLDLHGNTSKLMTDSCDALIGYRTNPHLDQLQRGLDAAHMMARTLRGEIRPTMAAQFPPMAINIERQHSFEEPCKSLYQCADEMLMQPKVLSNTLMLGFPYADVPEMGCAVMVVTDNDASLARKLCAELAQHWWDRRAEFVGHLISIDDAVLRAKSLQGPVCLLDMGDNVGGGSPGDGTEILHALARHRVGPAFVCLHDPEAVRQADEAGVGAKVRLSVGGHADSLHGASFTSDFIVQGFFDGKFEESQARHGGIKSFDQGRTALVHTPDGITVMLTTRRMVPFSLKQLTTFGVDPAQFQVLVAKGVNAPVAAYAPVCKHLIRVDTPGVTCADVRKLPFHNRRRPMFPFEPDMTWTPE